MKIKSKDVGVEQLLHSKCLINITYLVHGLSSYFYLWHLGHGMAPKTICNKC